MKVKNIVSKILIICLLLMLTACDKQNEYYSNDIDLHSIAINSLLGVYTRESDQVQVLETDDFGRKLFAFNAYTFNHTEEGGRILAVLVSQKTKDDKAYFYDNVDCLYCPAPSPSSYKKFKEQTEQIVKSYFTDEQISSLKEANDWDKPLDSAKFFEIKADSFKKDTVSELKRHKAFLMVGSDAEYKRCRMEALTTDKNGKSIYFVRTAHSANEDDKNYIITTYAFMFDKNGNVDSSKGIMAIKDVWDYSEQLAAFKAANDWNK